MTRTTKILLFMSLISLGFGCSNTTSKAGDLGADKVKESKFYQLYPEFSTQDLKTKFQGRIGNSKVLNPLYSSYNYTPIWVNDTLNTQRIDALVTVLSNVDKHGLPKQTFPYEQISSIAQSIDSGEFSNNLDGLYSRLVELEELASLSAIKYAVGMKFGFLNPRELYGRDYAIAVASVSPEFYTMLYNSLYVDPVETLKSVEPHEQVYLRLQEEFVRLDSLKQIPFTKIQPKGKAVYKILDRGDNISAIAKRLAITGQYTFIDTIGINGHGYILDGEILAAVNKFRKENSQFEEKEIGAPTIEALNKPLSYYQDKIKINMERYRWRKAKERQTRHIEVNVASQQLIAINDGKQALEMRVAVGSLKNKTPLLQSDLSYINLNPIWNVPTSITRKELAVKQKNNRSYLKKNNMKLYKGGKEVDIESIDWDNVDPETFSYSIKQSSGDFNALGKMKFMFNNNFAVYLHDTPSKAAFGRKNRAVSHGCVRLQNPIDLALFCTHPNDPNFADRLYHTIDMKAPSQAGQKLQAEKKLTKMQDIVRMEEPISLSIDYYTVYLKPQDSTVYYADDVYNYDKLIQDGLAKLVTNNPISSKPKTVLVNNKKGK